MTLLSYWKVRKPNMSDLAARYKVDRTLATKLVRQYRKDPSFLARLNCKEQIREEKVRLAIETVQEMLDRKQSIWTIS